MRKCIRRSALDHLLKWIWLAFLPLSSLIADEQNDEQPYVTCHFGGQLGNQMFTIAATLAYAWDYQVYPIFPELNRTDFDLYYNRDHIFFRLDASPLPRSVENEFRESGFDSSERIPYHPDQHLVGYFQAWNHFHHHREKILEIFAPSERINEYLESKYADILAHPNTVGVHVRTYNKERHETGWWPFLGLGYYQQAMDLFPEDTVFILFSDRINWCKQHFSAFNKNIIYKEDNDYIQDLFLMSKLKHHIIANSSFSWWGAYLNTNPDKIVIAPRYWMHPETYAVPSEHPNFLYLPDWVMVNADYDAPYPEDMRWYDDYSKCPDTQ